MVKLVEPNLIKISRTFQSSLISAKPTNLKSIRNWHDVTWVNSACLPISRNIQIQYAYLYMCLAVQYYILSWPIIPSNDLQTDKCIFRLNNGKNKSYCRTVSGSWRYTNVPRQLVLFEDECVIYMNNKLSILTFSLQEYWSQILVTSLLHMVNLIQAYVSIEHDSFDK